METKRTYFACDLKSFYSSVECVERGLDPLTTKLVVADASRTNKTICLAVTPALKAYGLSGRSRLFEVEQKAREVYRTTGQKLEYITAVPRMALYMKYSAMIYSIYLKYFSPDDIQVYSIDEVFVDMTGYLKLYGLTARELAMKVIKNILSETGITATAGIAPNLYLAKIAMDVEAKHVDADKDGVRIAELDEKSYRTKLWDHKPITDFWRVGPGIAERLRKNVMYTMGDIARRSLNDEESLYRIFGVDAEILIDHAWGYEPCTLKDIKAYKSEKKSVGQGQVLQRPYSADEGKIIVREMSELLALDLFEKDLVTSSITLQIGYDRTSLDGLEEKEIELSTDYYGREVPKSAHGTIRLGEETNSAAVIVDYSVRLYERIIDQDLKIRRVNINANDVISRQSLQPSLFEEKVSDVKEEKLQKARIDIMKKFGKNSLLKGVNLEKGAMTRERNNQIGGHKA